MKNIVNYLIQSMELNGYNFKVKENGWDDTITVVLIDNEGEETFIIDFNIELEKIYISYHIIKYIFIFTAPYVYSYVVIFINLYCFS